MTYSPESQVVARQLDYFTDRHVLIAGELEDSFAAELLAVANTVSIFTTNLAYANQMQSFEQINVQFGATYQKNQNVDMLLLYWPKAKAEASFLLAMLMSELGQGCEVVIVGENRSGVKSAEKLFADYGKLVKYDSARRCSFYFGQCDEKPSTFNLSDWYKSYPILIDGKELIIRSLPGVFSHGELDKGSALLLANLKELKGDVLDFVCGAGVLGAAVKQRFPECNIHMVDISALAVESAKETLRVNGLDGEVYASNVYSNIDTRFKFIISNPPFHAGLKTHYAATETMLATAPKHMKMRSSLIIVANNFLQYPPIIEQAFRKCHLIDKNNQFSIYQGNK